MEAVKDFMRREQEERRKEKLSLRDVILQKHRFLELPHPPSPLGLSNYDALDLEDDLPEFEDDQEDDGVGRMSVIYSDFNIMNPTTSSGCGDDDYDYLDALDGIHREDLPNEPPSPPPEEAIVEMLKEDHREEGYFVEIRG